MMTSTRAVRLRPGRARVCSRLSSSLRPSASSGVTVVTRRDPTQEAAQVVSTTPTTGTKMIGSLYVYPGSVMRPVATAMRSVMTATPVPTRAPISDPITPTTSPSRAMRPRSRLADDPSSRNRAMLRTRPATIVENVLAVTTAAT